MPLGPTFQWNFVARRIGIVEPEAAKILRRIRRALDDLDRAPVDLPDRLDVLRAAQADAEQRLTVLMVPGSEAADEFTRFEETRM